MCQVFMMTDRPESRDDAARVFGDDVVFLEGDIVHFSLCKDPEVPLS